MIIDWSILLNHGLVPPNDTTERRYIPPHCSTLLYNLATSISLAFGVLAREPASDDDGKASRLTHTFWTLGEGTCIYVIDISSTVALPRGRKMFYGRYLLRCSNCLHYFSKSTNHIVYSALEPRHKTNKTHKSTEPSQVKFSVRITNAPPISTAGF